MSKASNRPASGRKPGSANKDIVNFLNTNKGASKLPQGAPAFGRQDTGFSRASGDFSDRDRVYSRGGGAGGKAQATNYAAPSGASDYGDLGIPTQDRRDYGQRKRVPFSAADQKDKIIEFERENNTLKEKENFLRQEITMMTTKLRRVESMIKSRGRMADEFGDYDVSDMQRDLKDECEDLKDQNDQIREKVRKLNVVQRGLTQQMATGPLHKSGLAKNDKYAHVQGKLAVTHSKVTKRYQDEAKDLRAQITINQRKALELEQDLKEAVAKNGGSMGQGGADQIRTEILDMQGQVRAMEGEMERLQGDFQNNETIFKESKNYVMEMQEKLRRVNQQNETIKQENFRLQLQTQEVSDIQRELEDTQEARDNIERAIRNVTAEPFLRKDEGNSVAVRIQDLQTRLVEKDRVARKIKEEENQLVNQFKEQEVIKNQLQGETNQIEGSHKAVQEEFKERQDARKGPTEQDAVHGLIKMDAAKYSTLMTDLAMGVPPQGNAPIWANLPFLEQHEVKRNEDPKKQLKAEIDRLRQEKSDFASELEKAQNLIRLQTDIEKENTVYYLQEEKRLKLIEKSITAKVEELSRRADDKTRAVFDLERKVTQDLRASGAPPHQLRQSVQTDIDARSEFSAQTQESEVQVDENILDFKVEDAEFDAEAISVVPSVQLSKEEIHRQFITVVTVDFYNHSTETTQMSEGLRANYQTQFSFVNKVDSFYVNFLQRQSLKLDVYVSKNNAAVQVGRAEILLKELIESEQAALNVNLKTPVIQRWARVYPVSFPANKSASGVMNDQMRPLGVIKFKMRLRKPIQEQMRYFREQTEIKNIEKFVSLDPKLGSVKPQKKLITISIKGAQNLKMRYSDVSNVSPFFFYQFYTFDDRYSANSVGTNPTFNDTYSYEVLVDSKAIQYFEKESLEVILFDDNAPIAGVSLDQQQQNAAENDDMIGVCKIPLTSLVTGCSVHERYPIRATNSQSEVGQLEVQIDIMALESAQSENLFHKATTDLIYSKEFEQDIIMQIARKLAPLNCEIELMFGIFSQGQRNCTKEDFKHTCLQRLRLAKDGMQERELDIFLTSNDQMRDSNVIEKADFVDVFAGAIAAARNERLNKISLDQSLARDMSQTQSHGGYGGSQVPAQDRTVNMAAIQEQELYEILSQAILMGSQYKIMNQAKANCTMNRMTSQSLMQILIREGGIHDMDAQKLIRYLEVSSQVDLGRLDDLFNRAKAQTAQKNENLKQIDRALQQHARLIIGNLEQKDYNNDGLLNIDGFLASLRISEVGLDNAQLSEVFYLVCGPDETVAYQSWILQKSQAYKVHFTLNVTPRIETSMNELDAHMSSMHEASVNDRISQSNITNQQQQQMMTMNTQQKYTSAKQKIEQYIVQQDLNLGMMFAIMDTDSDSNITFPEFRQKIRAMHIALDDDECNAFFRRLDMNNSQTIDFDEFVNEFATINAEKIIEKIKKILIQGKIDPEYFFNKHSQSDRTNQKLTPAEFRNLLKEVQPQLIKREIYHMHKHFDRGNKGNVTKTDFLHVISSDFIEQKTFTLSIEDIIKPLATKARRFNANLGDMFDRYDTNRNGRLSAEELRTALGKNNIVMSDEDVQMLKEYFRNKRRTEQINKTDFIELMNTQFERKFDQLAARKSLADIKMKAEELKMDNSRLQEAIQSFNDQRTEMINIVGFKKAINNLKCLDQYAIDNLAKFLDTNNEGFISISSCIAQINNAAMGASFGSMTNNKWSR